jgi:hypothetical protein
MIHNFKVPNSSADEMCMQNEIFDHIAKDGSSINHDNKHLHDFFCISV